MVTSAVMKFTHTKKQNVQSRLCALIIYYAVLNNYWMRRNLEIKV